MCVRNLSLQLAVPVTRYVLVILILVGKKDLNFSAVALKFG